MWAGSGHLAHFVDPLTECRSCRRRYRADHLVDADMTVPGTAQDPFAAITAAIAASGRVCPDCGATGEAGLADPRTFNMLFKTTVGPVQDDGSTAYLRPETAQGVYTQWRNIHTVTRQKLPLGVASVGRSYRNEISTSSFIFRTREFEQAEIQYFCMPEDSMAVHEEWIEAAWAWLLELGINPARLRKKSHGAGELAHYALATTDIEYLYPFGWGELW